MSDNGIGPEEELTMVRFRNGLDVPIRLSYEDVRRELDDAEARSRPRVELPGLNNLPISMAVGEIMVFSKAQVQRPSQIQPIERPGLLVPS